MIDNEVNLTQYSEMRQETSQDSTEVEDKDIIFTIATRKFKVLAKDIA